MNLRLGTRSTPLALAQADIVRARLVKIHPGVEVTVVPFGSPGDRDTATPLTALAKSVPGLWSDEIDRALQEGFIDAAVHSLKDLDLKGPEGIAFAAFPEREDARDAWVGRLDPKTAGTCSARRSLQLARIFPGIDIKPIRGPVARRVEQATGGGLDGTVLAMAGLSRAGLGHHVSRVFSIEEMVPCAGQGILAVTCREGDTQTLSFLKGIDVPEVREAALAERELHLALGLGLDSPMGVFVRPADGQWQMTFVDFRPEARAPGQVLKFHGASAREVVGTALRQVGPRG